MLKIDIVKQMRDCFAGERAIKMNDMQSSEKFSNDNRYLPATSGQLANWDMNNGQGRREYRSYVTRATWLSCFSDTVLASLGIMASNATSYELPDRLLPLLDNITIDEQNIDALEAWINTEQLIVGRCGILVDVEADREPDLPFTVQYKAEQILEYDVNRADELSWIVLDETGEKFDYATKQKIIDAKIRLCAVADGKYYTVVLPMADPKKHWAEDKTWIDWDIFNPDINHPEYREPMYKGKMLNYIPFTFVNVNNLSSEQQQPPLVHLSNTVLSHYRGSADYRLSLFMQGQATPYIYGVAEMPKQIGATTVWHSPSPGSDVKLGFLEVSGAGLSEMRQAQEELKLQAQDSGVSLVDSSLKESGEALQIRIDVKTNSLKRIAKTGADAIRQTLGFICDWIGADAKDVTVTPNTSYTNQTTAVGQYVMLVDAKEKGAVLSNRTIHKFAEMSGLTELSYEDELENIEAEPIRTVPTPFMGGE